VRLAAVVVAAAALAVLASPAGAEQSPQDRAKAAYDQSQAIERQQAAAKAQVADLQKQHQQLDTSLVSLASQVTAANDRLAAAQAEVDRLAAVAADLQAKVDDTTRQLDQAQTDMRRSALLLYTQHGAAKSTMIAVIGATDGSGSVVEVKHYLERVSDKRHGDAVKVVRLRDALEAQQAQVAQQKQAADDARATAADERDRLAALLAEQSRSRDAVSANEAQTTALVSKLNGELASAASELAAANAAITASLARAPEAPAGPSPSGFLRPVGGPVTSGFGNRTDPVTGAIAFHAGIDFGSPCGTPIKAAATGVVFQVTPEAASGGYGNMTIIRHGPNLATVYAHQSSIAVSPGQTVSIGQVIGYVGTTGKSTGCHLHWEVRVNGNPVNPAAYL
jgi:murein DD-endopeptidase MepM/ murein hydrolase activator NlpD